MMTRVFKGIALAMVLAGAGCAAAGDKTDATEPDGTTCAPECNGRQCGDDGCGGICGRCGNGSVCDAPSGTCKACTPACGTATCGDDGCGGACGTCRKDETCNPLKRVCIPTCQPDCSGKECGNDGCGGSCGTCQAGVECSSGACLASPQDVIEPVDPGTLSDIEVEGDSWEPDGAGFPEAEAPSEVVDEGGSEVPRDVVATDLPVDILADLAADALVDLPDDLATDLTTETMVGPCTKDKDCENADLGQGEACRTRKICQKPANVCAFTWEANCCREAKILEQGFENGLEGWTVSDPNLKDRVTWSVSDHRKALGGKSLYFGDPTCRTYYNGALDAECKAVDPTGRDATVVRAGVTSPTFLLPPLDGGLSTFFVSFSVWIDSEPDFPGIENQPDQFRLLAVENPGASERSVTVFTSVDVNKTTGGAFVHVVGDLSQWAGTEIALRLFFDSLDEGRNTFEGVYVDDVKVATGCNAAVNRSCTAASPCPADSVECTSDACQMFSNAPERGICEYPLVPACVQPECTAANVAATCPVTEDCVRATCPAGACVFETIPPETCCKLEPLLEATFDDGLDGFTVWSYQDNPNIRWQVSPHRSTSGGQALYYGNLSTLDYSGDTYAFGEATSAPIDVPAEGFTFLSFQLFLSTEYDEQDGPYLNPMGNDLFEALIVSDPGTTEQKATTVWSSHYIQGTTLDKFEAVGVDLTGYAGKQIQLRFRFDPADLEKNAYEGVYVDDVAIVHDVCKRRDCKSAADCLIDGVCRTGSCASEVCDVRQTGPAGCCSTQTECDDLDPCTMDGCLLNYCVHDPVEMPGCPILHAVPTTGFGG